LAVPLPLGKFDVSVAVGKLSDEVEVYESYTVGKARNMHRSEKARKLVAEAVVMLAKPQFKECFNAVVMFAFG
jgi:hypothetical protein